MFGLLIANANKEYIDFIERVIRAEFQGQINVFKALHYAETMRALEKLPIDMMMINFEMSGSPGASFFTNIRKMDVYKKAPLIITTLDSRRKVEMLLEDEAYQIGILAIDDERQKEKLCHYLKRGLMLAEGYGAQYLRFSQKARTVIVALHNFILAEPTASGGKKTRIVYLDEETGQVVEDVLSAYSLKRILTMPHNSNVLTRIHNSMVVNLNRVRTIDHKNNKVTFRDIEECATIGRTHKEEIYKALRLF